ncbi:hypothetical protein [Halosegnis sp.]|uniref:hypothetical protein n=1 Tax=Halosegnis sp. TaxID=2864959 RepID=UPI0035D4A089
MSDEQSTPGSAWSQPTGETTGSSPTVLLAVARSRNRELLAAHLDTDHAVVTPTDGSLPEFDSCLVDAAGLDRWAEPLADRREAATGFLPIVFVGGDTSALEDGLVDEVLPVPVKRSILDARLSNLLDRRRGSLALASARRQNCASSARSQRECLTPSLMCSSFLTTTASSSGGTIGLSR